MLEDGADLEQGQAVAGEDTRVKAALGDGATWLCGFSFLIYILQSPGTRVTRTGGTPQLLSNLSFQTWMWL